MKIYIVVKRWVESYEDHGTDIEGIFTTEEKAENFITEKIFAQNQYKYRSTEDDWWIEEHEVQ